MALNSRKQKPAFWNFMERLDGEESWTDLGVTQKGGTQWGKNKEKVTPEKELVVPKQENLTDQKRKNDSLILLWVFGQKQKHPKTG